MISIAICSHNRSEDVARCLLALAPQLEPGQDELLIVDSCSAPSHAEALRSLAATYRVQLLRVETPGLSLARNAALAAARGEWVAYLDDDAIPFSDWLTSLHRVIDSAGDELAAVGGLTEPLWPDEPAPGHISPRWLLFLSCIQEKIRRSVREGAKVCGANLAFRRDALAALGGFRAELGRTGNRLISGEESLVVRLMLRQGFAVMYEPSVKVRHRIHHERLTIEWIRQRAYWEGVTEVALAIAAGDGRPWRLAIPKLVASAVLFGALYFVRRNPDDLIRSRIAIGALAARFRPIRGQCAEIRDYRPNAYGTAIR